MSGWKDRREREREEVRERILNAARELFVAEGYDAVSMRKIGAKVGYSAMALYRHFRDKDDLLRTLCEADFRRLREAMDRVPPGTDPVTRLFALGEAYVRFAVEYPNQYRLLFLAPLPAGARSESKDHVSAEEDAYEMLRATVSEAIRRGCFRPEHRDDHLIAQTLWAGMHGVVAHEILFAREPDIPWRPLAERSALMTRLTLGALLTPEASSLATAARGAAELLSSSKEDPR
jgi:AcrR family transcriptional regulator